VKTVVALIEYEHSTVRLYLTRQHGCHVGHSTYFDFFVLMVTRYIVAN
jgi:hypothetical protein